MKSLIIRYIEALNDIDIELAGNILDDSGVLDTY
jgi:hypothetical protein